MPIGNSSTRRATHINHVESRSRFISRFGSIRYFFDMISTDRIRPRSSHRAHTWDTGQGRGQQRAAGQGRQGSRQQADQDERCLI
jgi:hypothetical protein